MVQPVDNVGSEVKTYSYDAFSVNDYKILYGDINGDGVVDMVALDLIMLFINGTNPSLGPPYDVPTGDPNDSNPWRYCGEYFDNETGSYYLRFRYYSRVIGRFSVEDPIRDGLN